MSQTHYLPVRLPDERCTEALWSSQPTGHLVIFVHGFGGTATGTWKTFPSMLCGEAHAAGCDLVFYGYDGLHNRSTISAVELRDFISRMFARPLNCVNATLREEDQRSAPFAYTRITLVAHSLGAIVARDALLQGYERKEQWASMTGLVLFAPAHSGANVVALLRQVLFVRPIVALVPVLQLIGYFQVLRDLEEGSATLQYLLGATLRVLERGDGPTLMAKRVVIAGLDKVVQPIPFAWDPPPELIPGVGHFRVCKPFGGFRDPLKHLAACI